MLYAESVSIFENSTWFEKEGNTFKRILFVAFDHTTIDIHNLNILNVKKGMALLCFVN